MDFYDSKPCLSQFDYTDRFCVSQLAQKIYKTSGIHQSLNLADEAEDIMWNCQVPTKNY